MRIISKFLILVLLLHSFIWLCACGKRSEESSKYGPVETAQVESGAKTYSASEPIIYSAFASIDKYVMIKINKYFIGQRFPLRYYGNFDIGFDLVLAEVDVLFNQFGESSKELMFLPYVLCSENYLDYLVLEVVQLMPINDKMYYCAKVGDKITGFAFKNGKVDFSNEYFDGEKVSDWHYMNENVRIFASYPEDSNSELKKLYPDFLLTDGVSANKVQAYLEGVSKAAEVYWAEKLES